MSIYPAIPLITKKDPFMTPFSSRRDFLKQTTAFSAGLAFSSWAGSTFASTSLNQPLFKISLAQWSLHRALKSGKMDNLEFAKVAKDEFGISAVEYVNQFFKDKAKDAKYLAEMNQRASDAGVKNLLIMIDGEGALGDPDPQKRTQAIKNHHQWVKAAKTLGCHSIRVNARSNGSYKEQQKLAADGLRRLTKFATQYDINVLVENHGGLSSNGAWLAGVMKMVNLPNCGTLPDFGNFVINRKTGEEYDRYKGVKELMPYAKAVSAKTHDFDKDGNEINTDYVKMMKIVLDAGYHGYVGIEYEGRKLDEYAGIRASKKLLLKVRDELTPVAEPCPQPVQEECCGRTRRGLFRNRRFRR
ncbi:Xylose isomerase-like TIM barrel [Gimesia aquarii]|uniref:Xylose isomerase-like TIM barrel n=2 Tax=Gimesia aquarii TaxID=2527964 RepID=A0A517W4X0_9PLAN|nr:Xylose isomerase-like TIM barrel [Gimesia aquarii]